MLIGYPHGWYHSQAPNKYNNAEEILSIDHSDHYSLLPLIFYKFMFAILRAGLVDTTLVPTMVNCSFQFLEIVMANQEAYKFASLRLTPAMSCNDMKSHYLEKSYL